MNKSEFINAVALKAEVSKTEVNKIYSAMEDLIVESMKNREKITLTGFGTFYTRHQKACIKHNPRTREKVNVPEKDVVKFKLGHRLDDATK